MYRPIREQDVQRAIEVETGCGHAPAGAGIVDILTPNIIMEIKHWKMALLGLRQVEYYASYYSGKRKQLMLFGPRPSRIKVEHVVDEANRHHIELVEFDPLKLNTVLKWNVSSAILKDWRVPVRPSDMGEPIGLGSDDGSTSSGNTDSSSTNAWQDKMYYKASYPMGKSCSMQGLLPPEKDVVMRDVWAVR